MAFPLPLRKLETALRNPHRAYFFLRRGLKETFLWDRRFRMLREPKKRGLVSLDAKSQQEISAQLRKSGVATVDLTVDLADYEAYLQRANYARFRNYYPATTGIGFREKSLEHYLAARLLEPTPGDIYLDIANDNSPVPEIYKHLYGCTVYRQDLKFRPGIHDNVIGGDASNLPIPDCFATRLALHCSFEHFEDDADSRFIREASRVLRPGGRLCVVPLYFHTEYAIQVNPALWDNSCPPRDDEATLYSARGWKQRHCRYYDVPHFQSRILAHVGDLRLTIFEVKNEKAIHPSCYVKFVGLFEKP